MDVDMIAERIMQMIGFLFLNRINNTSKQNKVCIAHIALYVRIFQQYNSNVSIPLSEVHAICYRSPHNPLKKSIFFKS